MSFIFGGNTGMSYEDVQRKRAIAEQLIAANTRTPQNVGEGLHAIGRALAGRAIEKRTAKADEDNRSKFGEQFASAFGGGASAFGGGGATPYASPAPSPDPNSGAGVANDAMSVLGNFGSLEQQHGLPAGYLERTYQIESGGNPNAQNPNSSAGGGFQFIDSTAKQYGLENKFDLGASAAAAARLAADNKAQLVKVLGREPTAGELYLAHQQGGGGASKLLANPQARAVDIVGADAVRLNGGDANMTAGEFAGLWLNKFGGDAQPPQGEVRTAQAGGLDIATIADLASNPYATPGQKAVLEALMQQQMQSADPMRQMEMERARLELDALKNPQPDKPTATIQEYEFAKAQGYPGTFTEYKTEMAAAGKSSTNVTVGGQGDIGTIPQGYEVFQDETGQRRMRRIPGGPEDNTQTDAAAAGNRDVATSTITTAAQRAREAAGERVFSGPLSGVAAMNPSGANAEIYRQVEVLKSQAIVGNLQAMRDASPTGGALGAVTAPELKMLADKSGALDPRSPNFLRDLDDYERSLLNVIHGPEVGERIFNETRGGANTPDADGWQTINGVKVRVKQ